VVGLTASVSSGPRYPVEDTPHNDGNSANAVQGENARPMDPANQAGGPRQSSLLDGYDDGKHGRWKGKQPMTREYTAAASARLTGAGKGSSYITNKVNDLGPTSGPLPESRAAPWSRPGRISRSLLMRT